MLNTILLMSNPQQGGSGGGYMNILFIIGMIAVFYFFMIRPQTKKASDQKNFINDLQKGDKIVTIAGIHGKIMRINDNGTVEVEIDTNVKIIMERSGISMEYTK
ncbi:MAG: preprotein translocase subunit YajC, partial [Pseudomonadota bacterium]